MWWKAWSWKWTVSKILSEKLWYEIISIWDMKRKLAKEMWLNIHEFNLLWEKPENAKEFDLKYEEFQKWLDLNSNIILDSRLWFFAQPNAFKILLDVSEEIAGERIYKHKKQRTVQINDWSLFFYLWKTYKVNPKTFIWLVHNKH